MNDLEKYLQDQTRNEKPYLGCSYCSHFLEGECDLCPEFALLRKIAFTSGFFSGLMLSGVDFLIAQEVSGIDEFYDHDSISSLAEFASGLIPYFLKVVEKYRLSKEQKEEENV